MLLCVGGAILTEFNAQETVNYDILDIPCTWLTTFVSNVQLVCVKSEMCSLPYSYMIEDFVYPVRNQ